MFVIIRISDRLLAHLDAMLAHSTQDADNEVDSDVVSEVVR
jgi:hypothetical protein